jgi:hypothetical protein
MGEDRATHVFWRTVNFIVHVGRDEFRARRGYCRLTTRSRRVRPSMTASLTYRAHRSFRSGAYAKCGINRLAKDSAD